MTRLPAPSGRTSAGEDTLAWQIRAAGLPEPVREHRFHPSRRWRLDFAYVAERVAIEVEGGTYSGGRHVRGAGFTADCAKYAEASLAGWLVLRVTSAQVESGEALAWIARALELRGSAA